MAINKKNLSGKGSTTVDVVSMLKVLILVAIFLVPVTFMFIDLTNSIQALQQGLNRQTVVNQASNQPADFVAPLDQNSATDMANVPKEEIDTLFNNLQK